MVQMACTRWAASASAGTVDAVGWRWTISRARLGPETTAWLGVRQQLVDNLTHALAGADFDSLDERDDDGRFRDERLQCETLARTTCDGIASTT